MFKHSYMLLVSIVVLIGPPLAQASSMGELEISNANGQRQTALLLNTAISGEVNGMLASLVIEQTFENQSEEWVNGRYVFPLSETAAVDGLQIKIGERIINAVVKAKAEARATFEKAQREGKKAGLVEQHRANLFSMDIANIGPGETVVARIRLIDAVVYQDQAFSLILPTTLTPRYIPGAPIKLTKSQHSELSKALQAERTLSVNNTSGWAQATAQVPDADKITPPQKYPHESQSDHRFSLSLSLKPGLNLPRIESATHRIISQENTPLNYSISLASQSSLMNKDLVLQWHPQISTAPKAAFFQQAKAGNHYAMVMLTPPQLEARLSLPRDVTFIIDSSGSMAGESMLQAKQALQESLAYLNSSDTFNIVDFDSDFHALFESSSVVSPSNLQRARSMIDALSADGGTEMSGALKFALGQGGSESRLRQIIFITDGAVGNEAELFKLIADQLGEARMFTVGIGSAPNAFFMRKAAKFGRGSYTYIRNTNDVQAQMASLLDKISAPVMRDIKLSWPADVEQFPTRIPDLYAGEPIQLFVKSKRPLQEVIANGSLLDTPWHQTLSLANGYPIGDANNRSNEKEDPNLDTVWARAKITDLMDQVAMGQIDKDEAKVEITKLGIEHSIVSKFTSLIAVEQTPSRPVGLKSKHKNVPNLMPQGSQMPIPQTASWSTVLTVLGSSLLLLSGLVSRRRRVPTSAGVAEA